MIFHPKGFTLYFEHLVWSTTQHFTNLVIVAERIEQAIKIGKIVDLSKKMGFTRRKKEAKVHHVKGRGYKGKKKYHDNNHSTYNFQTSSITINMNFTSHFLRNQSKSRATHQITKPIIIHIRTFKESKNNYHNYQYLYVKCTKSCWVLVKLPLFY